MRGYPEVPPDIGYRLAGYIDGEGSFAITKQKKVRSSTVSYGAAFIIQVRDDDVAALELYQQATGCGVVYLFQRSQNSKWTLPGSKPYAKWQVQNKRDCLRMAEILEAYPLVTKKARDCAIWIQAVRYWNGPKPEGQAPLGRWFHEIREVRRYEAPDVAEITSDWTPLELFSEASPPAKERP